MGMARRGLPNAKICVLEGDQAVEPLVFDNFTMNASSITKLQEDDKCVCLLCDEVYSLSDKAAKDQFLQHLLVAHKLVIGDVSLVADISVYISYWKKRLKESPIMDFCTVIRTNSAETDKDPQELYYLLCDALPEDKQLRNNIQKDILNKVLLQQEKERNDQQFKHGCLFCRDVFSGDRAKLFNHMLVEHNFSVGKPDNLVFVDEFLDLLDNKLHSLQCLYCEKIFKDRQVLKEHMRKKGHKILNPKNKTYDKYYVVNYLEIGKNWEVIQSEDDDNQSEQSFTDDWSDWRCEAELLAVCLFCDHKMATVDDLFTHMKKEHHFDLQLIKQEQNLTFYQQVKVINYIRRQMYQNSCVYCQQKFVSRSELEGHLEVTGHIGLIPPLDTWDQPQYYFPTYEDDRLLCGLADDEEVVSGQLTESLTNSVVIAEDLAVPQSVLKNSSILKDLMAS